MNTSTPDDHDGHHAMREALRRDAAQVPEAPFDAALHYATMRRLRALADAGAARPRLWLRPAIAATAVAAALVALVALWPGHSSRPGWPQKIASLSSAPTPPRASLLAYQIAASEGDAAFFAMLDHDAATLLPASPPIFDAALR